MPARVVVLAGPSGCGKSRLADRSGLPVLRLDDFYRSGGDPALPVIGTGANVGLVDWDDPRSWLAEEAVATITRLCRDGVSDVPVYDIPSNGRTGEQRLALDGAGVFVAEGIFAQEIVPPLADAGLLEAALVVRQRPLLTFWRRLTRDLREHRKPPAVLVRRGLTLWRDQRRVVQHAVDLGCRPMSASEAADLLAGHAVRRAPTA